jgi:hypothetical protein
VSLLFDVIQTRLDLGEPRLFLCQLELYLGAAQAEHPAQFVGGQIFVQ